MLWGDSPKLEDAKRSAGDEFPCSYLGEETVRNIHGNNSDAFYASRPQ